MSPEEGKARKERDDTDASLAAERDKTDVQLANTRDSIETAADEVVQVARDRAESTLVSARSRADSGAPGGRPHTAVMRARASEDDAVADEAAVADERLQVERDERARALDAVLRLERDATDEGLEVERARSDQQVATRDDFLGMVSHDLRSMLGGIALNAGVLAKEAASKQAAERIQRLTVRMNRLVGDLLDVVSLEAGLLHVTLAADDAAQVVRGAIEACQPAFAAKGIAIVGGDDASLSVVLDHDRILQVLANLLGNSLKFTEPGGKVVVTAAPVDGGVRFSVVDTGRGIPEGMELAIFDRFEQAGVRDRAGLGLGLYIAKSIIDAHHGTIWAERPASGGAAVHFIVPRSPPAEPAAARP